MAGRYWLWVVGFVALVLWAWTLVLWAWSGYGRGGGYLSDSGTADGIRVHRYSIGGGDDGIVVGIVEVDLDTGCVWLSGNGIRNPVIWPVGTLARSDPFRITVRSVYLEILPVGKGQVVEPGDFVLGGGGYYAADSATRRLGLEPFPTECVTGGAAVFNAGEQIEVSRRSSST